MQSFKTDILERPYKKTKTFMTLIGKLTPTGFHANLNQKSDSKFKTKDSNVYLKLRLTF